MANQVNLAAVLVQAGVVSAILGTMLALVRIAIGAERRRADDWRTAYQTQVKVNEVMSGNVEGLVTSTTQLTAAQQETLALLRTMAAERRSTA